MFLYVSYLRDSAQSTCRCCCNSWLNWEGHLGQVKNSTWIFDRGRASESSCCSTILSQNDQLHHTIGPLARVLFVFRVNCEFNGEANGEPNGVRFLKVKVQQRGIPGTRSIIEALVDGMDLPDKQPLLVVDVLPSRWDTTSQLFFSPPETFNSKTTPFCQYTPDLVSGRPLAGSSNVTFSKASSRHWMWSL